MSDPRLRPESPSAAPDPVLGVPVVPGAVPPPSPVAFPNVTSEGVTPLRVAAMSREEALRRKALLETAATATAPTPISVRVVHPAEPAEDAVDATLRIAVLGMTIAVIAAMAWGVVQLARGLTDRSATIEITDTR